MKLFNADQIRAWDAYTIAREPIPSVDLMNRAAGVFADWFASRYPDSDRPVWVFAGTGNNGGDGVAVARLLHRRAYAATVFVCDFSGKHSDDFDAQIRQLPPHGAVEVLWLKNPGELPAQVPANAVLVDALFGTGLSRPPEGAWAQVIDFLNRQPNPVAAIDLPSGLFADAPTEGPCVRATETLSFQIPKRAFFFPENEAFVGQWFFENIGLHPAFAAGEETPFHLSTHAEMAALLRPRPRFSHKGTYGHALLIGGSTGKMGAAVLAARACLRSGAGLLTLHTPRSGLDILQTAVPEAMCSVDRDDAVWTEWSAPARCTAIGCGPGIGTAEPTAGALKSLLQTAPAPLVLDADALNILAANPDWLALLPKNSILTPHPKEFERLFGPSPHSFARNDLLREKARALGVYILLKGAFSAIACPDGACWFNPTGNPGMAKGGSGDVLTGILTGLRAQGYGPLDTCLLGAYLHGLAGDEAAATLGRQALTAGDLTEHMAAAWQRLS